MPHAQRFSRFLVIASLLLCAPVPHALAQNRVLLPEQSEAKARQIIQQAIDALGGDAYLNLRDVTCTGRIGQFDHAGDISGFENFVDYAKPPDKDRQENLPKRNIINVFNGDKGWELDRGGVSEAPSTDVAQFGADMHKDLDHVLRHRIHEPGMILRYDGSDIVDLRDADWIGLVDNDNNTIRVAFARATHLPLRKVFETRDPRTQLTTSETEIFSNFHPIQGIQTAFQITRERNGLKVFQAFFEKCDYNTNISDALFTKQSLDDRWAQLGGKNKDKIKDKKDKNSGKDSDRD